MSVLAFNSFPNGEYSNFFIVVTFSSRSFSGKTYLPVKNSYLLTFPDGKAEILAVFLNCIELVLLDFVIDYFDFITNTHFYNKFFLNRKGLFDDKVSLTKNEYSSLV